MSDSDRPGAEAHKYPQVVRFVRETPWAILETTLRDITEMVALRSAGQHFTDEEIQARIGSGPARKQAYVTDGSVAVIPIYGVITPKADLMSEISGGTSIERLQDSVRAAVADPKVKSILLDVNSPGGSVSMLNEMAAEIRQARRSKPVVAIANPMAASAAYQLASQASEFVVTPSGSVGSIGTIAVHDDISAMQEAQGVKSTMVTAPAGGHKAELSPLAPLSEDAKAHLQDTVDKYYGMFVSDVARGRGVPVETVRSDYGKGRMLLAKDAKAAGMVDAIETYDSVLARLEKASGASPTPAARSEEEPPGEEPETNLPAAAESGLSFAHQADALRDSAEALTERLTSLAEVERGHLTVAKRDRLTACTGALRESVTALEGVLTDTDPNKPRAEEAAAIGAYLERLTGGRR